MGTSVNAHKRGEDKENHTLLITKTTLFDSLIHNLARPVLHWPCLGLHLRLFRQLFQFPLQSAAIIKPLIFGNITTQ
ncbi:hypothetical protein QG37_04110 [Candidozyma auris]|uniref:Uncharacterized protein n=1 Tax=Candidozyma auris TaxID=498019 RepID=A0A0L0NYK4_CANAR|nr:hypothetical protein QG37_04110 [[Candida] auris]